MSTDLEPIRQRARYNNIVGDLMDELENASAELGVYKRLLAMEGDLKTWVEEQMNAGELRPFLTEEMLESCNDSNVLQALELHREVDSCLAELSAYWQTTDEVRSESN